MMDHIDIAEKLTPDELAQEHLQERIRTFRMIFSFWGVLILADFAIIAVTGFGYGTVIMLFCQGVAVASTMYPLYTLMSKDFTNWWRLFGGHALYIRFGDDETHSWIIENLSKSDYYTMVMNVNYVFRNKADAVAVKLMREAP